MTITKVNDDNSAGDEPPISVEAEGTPIANKPGLSLCLGEKHVGPSQPQLAKYPQSKTGKQNRAFNKDWFSKFAWIEYSTPEDAVFCFPCRHFAASAYADNLFTERGFRNWKTATGKDGKLGKHAESKSHVDAMIMWQQYRVSLVSGSVFAQQSAANKAWVDSNRKYLMRILDALMYLAQQGLAFRGDDETEDSLNRGNFQELLSLLSSVDVEFHEKCKSMPSNAKYTSPEIQNELINIAASQIRHNISCDAIEANFITIMVDEARDVSRKEQMSLCIRYISKRNFDVREEFLTFEAMTDVDAEALCTSILAIMKTLGLVNCIVVAQCYDGASVMSGHVSGVQARIRDTYTCAVYIHCHAHRLNLVIVDVARQVQYADEFFDLIGVLYVFLVRFKVHEVFVRLQKERGLIVRELGSLSDTRWACRYRNIAVIIERFDVIVTVLLTVQQLGDADIRVQGSGILKQVKNCQFVANLVIFNNILSKSNGVSEALQSSTINIAESDKLITGLMSAISDLREKSTPWSNIWQEILTMCTSNNVKIELPHQQSSRPKRKQSIRESHDMVTYSTTGQRESTSLEPCDAIRIDVFLPVVDRILSELKRRFSAESLSIMRSLSSLLCPDSDKFLHFDSVIPFLTVYKEKCEIDVSLLEAEMTVASNLVKNEFGDSIVTTDLKTILKLLTPSIAFPNLLKCIQIALTVPVTSASCERSFSAMKLLKTYLRNKTGEQRLSDLAAIYINKERSRDINRDEIINSFSNRMDRRIEFN